MRTDTPKPCPDCGEKEALDVYPDWATWAGRLSRNVEEAVKAWNEN